MQYIQFKISINNDYQEALIAELEEMNFEGYQQLNDELIAFIPQKNIQIGNRERIEQLLNAYPGQNYIQAEETIEEKNWNREWEETIQPQVIGQYLIKPTWSSRKADKSQILLEIDPKMAFGTGYHTTTKLMLQMLPQFIKKDYKVLDAGTGTGILAIAAAKLGASKVVAFDNDTWAVQNANENVLLNRVNKRVEIREGSAETVKGEVFDTVMINITKNIIMEMFSGLKKMLKKGGLILISGLLKRDEAAIKRRLKENDFKTANIKRQEEWIAVSAKKM